MIRRIPLAWVMALAVIGACLNFIGLGLALHRIGSQASEGQRARITQCLREPVLRKIIVAGAHYHLLAPGDLSTFDRTAPSCPKP